MREGNRRGPRDENRYEIVVERSGYEARDEEVFDRIAFAMQVLDRLEPKNLKVVVYEGTESLQVERGHDPSRGPLAQWALVAIPRHASRAHIAYRLAELVGRSDKPYVVDCLLAG